MATVKNCDLPDELYYHVKNNIWLRDEGDGTYTIGMTDLAQAMAGAVIHCRIKKTGKSVKDGKSLATVESGKWVGPVKAPFACEVVGRNDTVEDNAGLLNSSPYGEGWLVKVKPADQGNAKSSLVQGEAVTTGFEAYIEEKGFDGCLPTEED